MAKQEVERRSYDKEFTTKLDNLTIQLTQVYERQQMVLDRLDKINGTVADYNANKYKMDLSCTELLELRKNQINHYEVDHKNMDERYIGRKLFTTLSIILGLLIVATNILQYFKL